MSVEAIALVLHHAPVSGTEKILLLGIANHDGDGGAWPAISTLAKYAGVNERAVQYALRSLETKGFISVQIQTGGLAETRDDRRPNRYELHISCPASCDRSKNHRRTDGVQSVAPRDSDGVQSDAPRGAKSRIDGVQPVAPEPSIEPSNNRPSLVVASHRPDAERICEHLATAIEANGSLRPTVTKAWLTAARLMLDKDGRTETQVHAAIEWCQHDEFWRSNILSVPKLRKQYDQLRLMAQRKPGSTNRAEDWHAMQERQMTRAVETERKMGLR